MRSRAAVLVAYLAAGAALPATAHAAECVKVVVDYGTIDGAPAGPNTRCVDVGDDGTAADALRGRARYKGNFLCAIDGYPETGCGDQPPSPYWSFWVWRNGGWVYSNEGVGTFTVGDADGDGHPDPLGFRYHEVDKRAAPRANPSYPKPATAPPRTTTAPRPAPTSGAVPGRTASPAPRATTAPGATAAATTGPTAPVSGTPSVGTTGTPTTSPTSAPAPAGSTAATPDVEAGELPVRDDDGGFPVGAVAGGVLALGLLGAAAYRFRTPGDA